MLCGADNTIMRTTSEIARQMVEVLEEIRDELPPEEEKARYPFTELERKRRKVKERLRELPRYVERAVDMITFEDKGLGRPRKLDLV